MSKVASPQRKASESFCSLRLSDTDTIPSMPSRKHRRPESSSQASGRSKVVSPCGSHCHLIRFGHGAQSVRVDKTEFRLRVDIPDAPDLHIWTEWPPANLISGTRNRMASSRYLLFNKVSRDSIIDAFLITTELQANSWSEIYSEELSARGVACEGCHTWHSRLLRDMRRPSPGNTRNPDLKHSVVHFVTAATCYRSGFGRISLGKS